MKGFKPKMMGYYLFFYY